MGYSLFVVECFGYSIHDTGIITVVTYLYFKIVVFFSKESLGISRENQL